MGVFNFGLINMLHSKKNKPAFLIEEYRAILEDRSCSSAKRKKIVFDSVKCLSEKCLIIYDKKRCTNGINKQKTK